MFRPKSLKIKLITAVTALVVGSGLITSVMVTYRYSRDIYASASIQSRHLAHQVALEATDKILINDLVALQKMIDYQMRSSPSLSYLFFVLDGQVLAHSFKDGFPVELIDANHIEAGGEGNLKKVVDQNGDPIFDMAWPVFDGQAGSLRLGISEKPYRQQVTDLWLQMILLTLAVLAVGIVLIQLFIRRITGPLSTLAESVEKVADGRFEVQVPVGGQDEVGLVAAAFNRMVRRIQLSTAHLEKKTTELDQAYRQIRNSFAIVQEIGAQSSLNDVCTYLINKFHRLVSCQKMAILVFFSNRRELAIVDKDRTETYAGGECRKVYDTIRKLSGITFVKPDFLDASVLADTLFPARQLVISPFKHEEQLTGALVIACTGNCACDHKGLDVIELTLGQTAGALRRASIQEEEIRGLHERIDQTAEFSGIVGKDAKMRIIYKLIDDIAPTDATVLIQGESGTGKELVARAIHDRSPRQKGPFVVINCSAFPTSLLESELFGHEEGAFTGAIRRKIGRFEQAHGGTVFLDEIGEIAPSAQIKLLRVLQTQKFERLGGEKTLHVDVRILAATNRDLLAEVRAGNFREDLFYRLNVIPITLPPLRNRKNDIPLLARYFLKRFAEEQNKGITDFSTEAMRRLLYYQWPGNVRDLENCIEHAVVLAKGARIEVADMPAALQQPGAADLDDGDGHGTIMQNEAKLLQEALEDCDWNKKQAAQNLGISRNTLYRKLRKYQIKPPTVH